MRTAQRQKLGHLLLTRAMLSSTTRQTSLSAANTSTVSVYSTRILTEKFKKTIEDEKER